ncbi:MAG: A/G-specific adenine glycosylase [Candidatus Reconcilbacillus cellulovorans]|uniref:Adenine DNA glycosylase n=1 Tax=Candidatus Reconcilbacillus cellulovorans TaxID=1906605 RepID=A0A2A6E341_9BACL|nr:MAG: A/G-specific adenine glycosylase [Candidatus Reconcilbacillus cellulovorans]
MELERFFTGRLLDWYRRHRRDLPWRRTRDPYRIWVSETMLQQTRVETVIPYYERFLERFPTVADLAAAPEADVLKAWEGLGYYSRARRLHEAAKVIVERYGGVFPDDAAAVAALPGVGPYTKGAVLSIAFGRPEPAVDGNVMRVLSRFFLIRDDIAKPATREKMEALARRLIPEDAAGDFNQALMELGATVCVPKAPTCLVCPVMERCGAYLAGEEEELPVKAKAKPPRTERRLVAWIVDGEGRLLIRRRPERGLLAGMWELPHVEARPSSGADVAAGEAAVKPSEAVAESAAGYGDESRHEALLLAEAIFAETGLRVSPGARVWRTDHVFSHLRWFLEVYACVLETEDGDGEKRLPADYRWAAFSELGAYTFPNAFGRILSELVQSPFGAGAGGRPR